MTGLPNVTLTLASLPENVSLVRAMLNGVAESVALNSTERDDIRAAVTEACNNVVLHAYPGARGSLEVDVFIRRATLEVLIRDRGIGFPKQMSELTTDTGGLGLPMMRALTRELELRDGDGVGAEARMQFATPSTHPLDAPPCEPSRLPLEASGSAAAAIAVTIAPSQLAGAVLPRVLSALAARAHFSTDRISDSQLLADALAAHARATLGARRVSFAAEVEPRDLHLQIGPLGPGRASSRTAASPLDGLGPMIEDLADAHRVTSIGPHEILSLRLLDRQRERP
jgi:serine/threonine-protein kinase RsbW